MRTMTLATSPSSWPLLFHRICAWCGCDLGVLDHDSQHHSYGICEACAHEYFAYLYEPEAISSNAAVAKQRILDKDQL